MSQQEESSIATVSFNKWLTYPAHFISYVFHPLFVPIYVVYFLIFIHPSAFTGFSAGQKLQTLIIVIINLSVYPLLTVLLLRAVKFIDSLFLKTQKDRIIPYIACGIFFFWAYTVFKEQVGYPKILIAYVLGLFIASSAALLGNIYCKVSMHAIGVGGWLGFFMMLMLNDSMLMSWPLSFVILITGLVCSSRMLLKAHPPFEIYLGLVIGIATQIAATYFV